MERTHVEGPAAVRVDKWLWAARFFKSRSIAVTAIEGGKAPDAIDGARIKRALERHRPEFTDRLNDMLRKR